MHYYVIYGKVVEDKDEGIYLAGTYFGGLGQNQAEASAIARLCVNSIKGGTIIPKIFESAQPHDLIRVMADAATKFRKMETQMIQTEDIISRSNGRRK